MKRQQLVTRILIPLALVAMLSGPIYDRFDAVFKPQEALTSLRFGWKPEERSWQDEPCHEYSWTTGWPLATRSGSCHNEAAQIFNELLVSSVPIFAVSELINLLARIRRRTGTVPDLGRQ